MSVEFGQKIGQKLMVQNCFFFIWMPNLKFNSWTYAYYTNEPRCFIYCPSMNTVQIGKLWSVQFNVGTRELNADLIIFIWKIISGFIQKILEYPSDLQNHCSQTFFINLILNFECYLLIGQKVNKPKMSYKFSKNVLKILQKMAVKFKFQQWFQT